MGYIGNEPTTGHFPVDNFTSSGGSTYTLAKAPASAGAIEVSVQGVLQPTTAYTVSGTTLNMAGVTTGVKIFVRHLGETLSLPTPADGSVTTTKLGTNSVDGTKIAMGSDARGDILYHGATDYARLAKGSSGQVLTMGANDPAWAAAAAGGAWTLIGTAVGSNSASLTVTGLDSTYDTYAIALSDVKPQNAGVNPILRLGDSSGVDSGASDYSWHSQKITDSSASYSAAVSTGTSYIVIGGNEAVGNSGGRGYGGLFYLHQPSDGTVFPHISGHYSFTDHSGNLYGGMVIGNRLAVIAVDRVFFSFNGTNTGSGRMTVWGIKHT